MNVAQIRKNLADKGIKVTANQIKKTAASLGLNAENWGDEESQVVMEYLSGNRAQPAAARPASSEYVASCDNSELTIVGELQEHALSLQHEKQAIAAGIANAAETFSDDLVEMVVQFKPLVYTRTAEKLRHLRQRDTGHSIAAAFAESFEVLALNQADVRLLPEATGHAR